MTNQERTMIQIGLGGGCHWCTEAVFQSLKGVSRVEQGWISAREATDYAEAVIVHFDPGIITLDALLEIHLRTHSCTSEHFLRSKYRSAVYAYTGPQRREAEALLLDLLHEFEKPVITRVMSFSSFKENTEEFRQYYYKNPEKPFCKTYIDPKLRLLLKKFNKLVDTRKLSSLDIKN